MSCKFYPLFVLQSVMIRSIFTSLSSLIFHIAYLHMPFPYFGSYLFYLSYLHVLSTIPILISYLLSCTQLVYKPNRYPETNQVCTLRNTAVLSTGSFLRLRLGLSWVGTLPELSSCMVLTIVQTYLCFPIPVLCSCALPTADTDDLTYIDILFPRIKGALAQILS